MKGRLAIVAAGALVAIGVLGRSEGRRAALLEARAESAPVRVAAPVQARLQATVRDPEPRADSLPETPGSLAGTEVDGADDEVVAPQPAGSDEEDDEAPGAAERLAELEPRRAAWMQRIEAFRAERDRIRARIDDEAVRADAEEALLAASFAGEELLRARAALEMDEP